KLAKKGIVAMNGNESVNNGNKKTGYPDKKITHYNIDGKNIAVADMPGFLANNKKLAAKILGRQGAFNLRVKMWSGKHITNKLFKKLNISKNGGIADGKKGNPGDKFKEQVPDNSKAGSVTEGAVKNKVNGL